MHEGSQPTINRSTTLIIHSNITIVLGICLIYFIDDQMVLVLTNWLIFGCVMLNLLLLQGLSATVFVKIYLVALAVVIQPFVDLTFKPDKIKILHLLYCHFHIMIMSIYAWLRILQS